MRQFVASGVGALLLAGAGAHAQTCALGSEGDLGFGSASRFSLVGDAALESGSLVLTPEVSGASGAAWFRGFRPRVTQPWFAAFDFVMEGDTDGLAFVIHADGEGELGSSGSGLGYDGIFAALAVEFDTFAFSGEFAADHVSVQTDNSDPIRADDGSSLSHSVLAQDLNDGETHRALIWYDGTRLHVAVDGQLEVVQPVDFATGIASPDGCAYVGFTAANGGVFARQSIRNWVFGQAGDVVDFAFTNALTLNGSASINGGELRLTPDLTGQAGSAWYTAEKSVITRPWVTTFSFRLDGTADGLSFVIQDSGTGALGGGGSDLGYGGIPRSVAVEFDTFAFQGEFAADHVSVQTQRSGGNSSDDSASLAHAVLPGDLNDGAIHLCTIAYDGTVLRVLVDGETLVSTPIDFANDIGDQDGKAWIGFTGSTGGATAAQSVLGWAFGTTPQCINTDLETFLFDQTLTPGDSVTFHFEGSGSLPLSYQWRLNGDVVTDGGAISGATTNTLTISPVGPEHAGQWDYGVGNECSGSSSGFFVTIAGACDPDANQDGNVDQGDVDYVINVVAGGDNPTNFDADFNRDGNVDQGDVDTLINVVAGGNCP